MSGPLTAAQQRVLKKMSDRPSDGVALKGGSYMAALSCVEKGWAAMVGRREVGGNFARLPAGRAVLRLDEKGSQQAASRAATLTQSARLANIKAKRELVVEAAIAFYASTGGPGGWPVGSPGRELAIAVHELLRIQPIEKVPDAG